MASLYFDILAPGEGEFTFPTADTETWELISGMDNVWKLKSDVEDPRFVWVTRVDGEEGPVLAYYYNTLVIRDE